MLAKFPVDIAGVRRFKQSFREQIDYIGEKIESRREELKGIEREEISTELPYLDELLFETRKQNEIHGVGNHFFPGLQTFRLVPY